MHSLSRSQLLVYGAVAVAILLLGARWIRSADAGGVARAGEVTYRGGEHGIQSAGRSGGGLAGGELVVHVAGAVRRPGVYRLPSGSRVTDAVERAGGMTAAAEPDAVNLAAQLADGQQVVIPEGGGAAPASGAASGDGPIGLGTATVEQLDTIEGIGPVTAQDIVDFRTQNGGVSSVEDLDRIPGIGPVTMEALRAALQP